MNVTVWSADFECSAMFQDNSVDYGKCWLSSVILRKTLQYELLNLKGRKAFHFKVIGLVLLLLVSYNFYFIVGCSV